MPECTVSLGKTGSGQASGRVAGAQLRNHEWLRVVRFVSGAPSAVGSLASGVRCDGAAACVEPGGKQTSRSGQQTLRLCSGILCIDIWVGPGSGARGIPLWETELRQCPFPEAKINPSQEPHLPPSPTPSLAVPGNIPAKVDCDTENLKWQEALSRGCATPSLVPSQATGMPQRAIFFSASPQGQTAPCCLMLKLFFSPKEHQSWADLREYSVHSPHFTEEETEAKVGKVEPDFQVPSPS